MITVDELIKELRTFYTRYFIPYDNNDQVGVHYEVNDSRIYVEFLQTINLRVRVVVHCNEKNIYKHVYGAPRRFVLFDRRELEFFDKLGFELDLKYQQQTKQDISDWWDY